MSKKESKRKSQLDYFFNPASVAIIGASRQEGKVGYVILQNFLRGAFKGQVYPVNPEADEILGKKCYKNVIEIKEPVESAVICVPAKIVTGVLKDCAKKKVKAVTIISAGFAEIGNHEMQKELEKAAKGKGMKIVGPNCLGVYDSESGADMLFLPANRLGRPGKGAVSFISQSGALGSAILDWDAMKGYGINKFVSYGNALDVSEADLLEYLAEDQTTKVIVLYIEGVKDGRKFLEKAKNAAKKKPVIVIKGGLSSEGSRAAQSHTGSLAGSPEVYMAAFRQAGLVQAANMEEVFNFARAFITEPLPAGKRVQIITDGGGYGVLAADAVAENGLELAQLSNEAKKAISEKCPSYVVVENPIDLTGDTDNERCGLSLQQVLQDKNVDMVLMIVLFQVPKLDERIVEIVAETARERKKPLVVMSAGGSYSESLKMALEKKGISTFSSPNDAVRALKALWEYSEQKAKKKK